MPWSFRTLLSLTAVMIAFHVGTADNATLVTKLSETQNAPLPVFEDGDFLGASSSTTRNLFSESSNVSGPVSRASTRNATDLLTTGMPDFTEERKLTEKPKMTDDRQAGNVTSEIDDDESDSVTLPTNPIWKCPNITKTGVDCSCDLPHTLRCIGDQSALQVINQHLQQNDGGTISLLDVTVTGISTLPAYVLQNVTLHGLVVSTGELRHVNANAFSALTGPLQALGLPNNLLESVPTKALANLVGLDRLDLSHNKLRTLEAESFLGLKNLTFLDLCDNLLSQLSPQVFTALPMLRSLRMHGNHLSTLALSALRGLARLEELDLSNNLLVGPMGPYFLPEMPRLRFLTVSENQLVNVQKGALMGLRNLTFLSLRHNQIDVLEDHSFKYLSMLTRLDLANNRIVAVSSASLAHLENLTSLDLTHNFLRSLTADLIVPLQSLQDLRLDDNDITMVASDVPTTKLHLKRLSLADNPLNCDCSLLEFANWLNNSSLSAEDRSSAVCATPPALENGILTQVSPGSLLCGEPTASIMTRVPLAGAQLVLKEFLYDGLTGIKLSWHVDPCTDHYTCDSLIVYETVDDTEVQIASSPLRCDSRMMNDPCTLPVTIPSTVRLEPESKYRYCVVLLISTNDDDDVSLGLGCSDVIALEKTRVAAPRDPQADLSLSLKSPVPDTQIVKLRANVSEQGFLHVDVTLARGQRSAQDCKLSVVVFEAESAVHRLKMNCTLTGVTLSVLLPGRYKVCASLDEVVDDGTMTDGFVNDHRRLQCVEVQGYKQISELIILAITIALCVLIIIVFIAARSMMTRIRHSRIQAQCFLPTEEFEITHKAHYIKLLAAKKV